MFREHLKNHTILIIVTMLLTFLLTTQTLLAEQYTDDNGRYTIWFPDNWTQRNMSGVDIIYMDPIEDDFRENMNVLSIKTSGVKNSREYALKMADEGIEEIQHEYPDTIVVSQPTAHSINNHWSATYVIDLQYSGRTIRESQTIIVSEGYSRLFVITCAALPHSFAAYQPTFDESINSFEILNELGEESPFPGFITMIILGAVVGGIAGGVVFIIANNQKKKSKPPGEKPIQQQTNYPAQTPIQPGAPPIVPPPVYPPYPPRR